MVDISAIAGLMTSMRSVVEITKAMKDVNDANVIQTKVFELTREIMAAQACAMEAQMAQSALLERVRDLEEEKAKLEAWNAEKGRYELREVSTGVYAYTMKPGMEQGQPFHMLCANCYDNGKRGGLQATERMQSRRRLHVCPQCKTDYAMESVPRPALGPSRANTDYDPFSGR
jgi:hypothetical protein